MNLNNSKFKYYCTN